VWKCCSKNSTNTKSFTLILLAIIWERNTMVHVLCSCKLVGTKRISNLSKDTELRKDRARISNRRQWTTELCLNTVLRCHIFFYPFKYSVIPKSLILAIPFFSSSTSWIFLNLHFYNLHTITMNNSVFMSSLQL
jgi:hypothetical protein